MGIKIINEEATDLSKLIEEASKKYIIEFGVREDAGSKNIMKAVIHEFGYDSPGIPVTDAMRKYMAFKGYPLKKSTKYIKIPARPFISKGIEDNIEALFAKMDLLTSRINSESPHKIHSIIKEGLEDIGVSGVKYIQEYMSSGKAKANHPMTIEGKGHSTPLVGKGSLKNSIGCDIIRK